MKLTGRILHLVDDPTGLRAQLAGMTLDVSEAEYVYGVNTDAMISGRACTLGYTGEILGPYFLENFQEAVDKDGVAGGGFQVVVGGHAYGSGSSREVAVVAHQGAGIELIVADSFQRIFQENMVYSGMPFTTDRGVVERLERGEDIDIEGLFDELPPFFQAVAREGGLLAYGTRLLAGEVQPTYEIEREARPMNIAEKIIASHLIGDGPSCVKPGDAVVARVDGGYSHEFTSAQVHVFLEEEFGEDYSLKDPRKFAVFEDHLIYADDVAKMRPFIDQIQTLRGLQVAFQRHTGVRDYSAKDGKSPGICHQVAREHIIEPGDFIQATDSHTCMGGASNSLAYGVGTTEYAALVHSGFTLVKVPESIRFELTGALRPGVAAKDVMLYILLHFAKPQKTLNRVMEFGGPGLASLSIDERATLANMATECTARTGVMESDDALLGWIAARRPDADLEALRAATVAPDPGAHYDGGVHTIDLATIEPMVATPGNPDEGVPSDPTNGALIRELGDVSIDIAYGGSCTAGKEDDLDMYAAVMAEARDAGLRVAEGVDFFIQFGSADVAKYAESQGYLEVFRDTGVQMIHPGCGACIGCGPGVSETSEQVTVSAINRNFQGRSGPGRLYLASPLTVAASAVTGRITAWQPGRFAKSPSTAGAP